MLWTVIVGLTLLQHKLFLERKMGTFGGSIMCFFVCGAKGTYYVGIMFTHKEQASNKSVTFAIHYVVQHSRANL